METYVDGTGVKLRVHDRKNCAGEYCSIHNPSNHKMKDWPTHWRDDRGIMERICECGVGHPDPDDMAFRRRLGMDDSAGIHGCCGCCTGNN